ncbi:MAG: ATPase [Desulfobacterales bacterium]|nr:ATPase [Desulfobacterales bacterium]MDD4072853.1 ATPase [Desulfobacterales bacterium]MDD4393944.1 ATPase [Desulfobacterales bacterium]
MISVNGSVWIQMANFLILIWVLNIVLYKPIRKMIRERQDKISGLKDGIETFDQQAKESETAYAEGLKAARGNGLKAKETLVQAAAEEEKKVLESINAKAQAQHAEVREKIAKEADAVRKSLEMEIDDFAEAIGQKILGRAVR